MIGFPLPYKQKYIDLKRSLDFKFDTTERDDYVEIEITDAKGNKRPIYTRVRRVNNPAYFVEDDLYQYSLITGEVLTKNIIDSKGRMGKTNGKSSRKMTGIVDKNVELRLLLEIEQSRETRTSITESNGLMEWFCA